MLYTEKKAPQVKSSNLSSTGVASDNGAMQSVFTYNDTPIPFSKGDRLMVNATQMAKAFGKLPTDWLRLKQAEELIHSLSVVMGIPITGLVVVKQGGTEQGTWLHEDLALIFAQWLSPMFYFWCNGRVKELLLRGSVSIAAPRKRKRGLIPAQHCEDFAAWRALMLTYLRPEDKRSIASAYGCGLRHVHHILAGDCVSRPLVEFITWAAKENARAGIRADRPHPALQFSDFLFTEGELQEA